MKVPFDTEDRALLVRLGIYSVLVLWVALILGLAVRLFLAVGFA